MKQSKALFIINAFENLSLTNCDFKIGSHLEKVGFTPYFLSLSPKGELKKKFLAGFGSRAVISGASFLKNIIALANLIKRENFNFISTQTLRADYAFFLAKMILRNRCRAIHVANRRNYFFLTCEPQFFIKNILYFISCHLANINICCAQHLASKLVSRLKVPVAKVTVIQNGVQLPRRARRLPRGKRTNISFTGQLVKRKNLLFLLKALQTIKADYHCLLIGSGPERSNLETYINNHNLQDRIEIIPNQLDVRPFLRQADIFVLPSLAEGMSLSLLEAMSFGIACMASDIDANREVIKGGRDGILFSLKNGSADLAAKLERLIADNSLRSRHGKAAEEKIAKSFTERAMLTAFADFYRHSTFRPRI